MTKRKIIVVPNEILKKKSEKIEIGDFLIKDKNSDQSHQIFGLK